MLKKIYIDLETTGLDPEKNGIIQIAGIIDAGTGVEAEFNFQVRPHYADILESRAMEVNGKTVIEVMNYPDARGVHKQLVKMLGGFVDRYDKKDKFMIYGFNSIFDANMLRAWFEKCGDKFFGSFFYYPPVDILAVAGWVLQEEMHELENFKLGTVAKYLGVEVPENMHDAMADIRVTKEIEDALIERIMTGMGVR